MSIEDELKAEFLKARDRYVELLRKLIELRVPGVIDPVAAKCSVGEVCHGGEFLTAKDIATQPGARG
jgi:CRISPR/Cas system-associated exonuclease Cas4 (RecB family)